MMIGNNVSKKKKDKLVEEAPYHPGYEDASVEDLIKKPLKIQDDPFTGQFSKQKIQDEIKASQHAKTGGRKFDGDKIQYGLLPPLAIKATAEILTFGAEKYEPDNWKYVPDSKRRYFDAAQRHMWAWKEGEQNDSESGKNHLAHALCCLMFLYEHDVKYSVQQD